MRIAALMEVRNGADVLRVNLAHHRALGIHEFWIVDNGSSDDTRKILRRAARRDRAIHWRSDRGPFRQGETFTALARDAFGAGADWVLPVDADEFWTAADRPLGEILAASEAAAIEAEVVNFVQARDVTKPSPRALLRTTWRPSTTFDANSAIVKVMEKQVGFIELRYPTKWVTRASRSLVIGHGNHEIDGVEGPRSRSDEITCLHAPLRARSILASKVEHGRRVLAANIPEGLEHWHLIRWQEIYDAEGETGLDAEWRANSYAEGALDVYGNAHQLVEDTRLRDVVAPHVQSVHRG